MNNADPLADLAGELSMIGRRLDGIAAQLWQLRATGGNVAAPALPSPPQAHPGPSPHPEPPRRPEGAPAGPVSRPRRYSALSGARLLAWTGGAVTLLGVVLFLVLAASRGWFSPPARIGAGIVLGLVLVGVGLWLHRRETARTGALALAATGIATLYLVVAAATALYGYLSAAPALLAALLVAAGGLGLADRWRAQLLGGGAVAGAAVLAPAIVADWLLVALVLALQLAALPVVLRRRWPVLMLVAAAGPVLYGSVLGTVDGRAVAAATVAVTVTVVLGVLALGLATAVPAARLLPVVPVAVLVAASPLALLVTGAALGGWSGAALAAVAALATGAVAAVPGTDRAIRLTAATAATVALFQATLLALDGASATAVLLGEAIVAAALAAAFRTGFALVAALFIGGIGTLRVLGRDAPFSALVDFPALPYIGFDGARTAALLTGAGVSALLLVLAVALLVAGGRAGLITPRSGSAPLWVPIGLAGLYGASSLVVVLALLVSPDRAGFTAGHALVTVSWTVAALVLLAHGISRPALRMTGLVLVAAAVLKLVLFDLVALDGLARVAAFLGAGLVLLAAGTRYARLVAEAEADSAPA